MLSRKTIILVLVFSVVYVGGVFLAFLFGLLNLQIAVPFMILDLPLAIALAFMDREIKRDTKAIETALGGVKTVLDTVYSKVNATIDDILSFQEQPNMTSEKMDDKSLNYIRRKLDEVSSIQANYKIISKTALTKKEIIQHIKKFYSEIANLQNVLEEAGIKARNEFFENVRKCKEEIESSANTLRMAGLLNNESQHRIADDRDVKMWGWDPKKLLDELIKLDYETMEGLTRDMEGSTDQWADVFSESPDTWRLLVNGSESIIGYWHFVPLFPEDFQKAKLGELKDSEIIAERIMPLDLPGDYDIYVVSIALRRGYRNHEDRTLLFGSFFEEVYSLAKGGIFIRNIVTNAFTPDGFRTCTRFGMREVAKHVQHGNIFYRSLYPFYEQDKFLQRDMEIRELYAMHYKS
ncbi:MAG: hypothetical protein M1113_05740 [Candidatus Thermoplasmatota archaeon]|nr:hypothetical protein [Candidatus Thermoplasmatota archaeon]